MLKPISLSLLKLHFPNIKQMPGERFLWSPKSQAVSFPKDVARDREFWQKLLHEYGHSQLKHTNYETDFELLRMELNAWEEAKKIASELGIVIEQDFIEDCLDTYRDWLHERSTCPKCKVHGIMNSFKIYECVNCHSTWSVPKSQLCDIKKTVIK